jgi:hypothetical protein
MVLKSIKYYKIQIFTGAFLTFLISQAHFALLGFSQPERARSVNTFVDSIGVAVHLSYTDTAYGKYNEIIKPRLMELGVSHIRDGLKLEDETTRQKFIDLAKVGIKSTLVMDPRDGNIPSTALKVAKSVPTAIEAVEGPNEWDVQLHLKYKGNPFPQGIRDFQSELYSSFKADPAIRHLPILSPSIIFLPNNGYQIGNLNCDYGNIHHYPRGKWGMPLDSLKEHLEGIKLICPNKPIIVTESGYNYLNTPYEKNKPGDYRVSEKSAAKYLLRLFLEYFNRGFKRYYVYQLIDGKPNPDFGLLRFNGSRKPSFIALRNLISILKDSKIKASNSFQENNLTYRIKGNRSNIRHVLLQKSNGIFYLILWQEATSFEHKSKKDLSVPERHATLAITNAIKYAAAYKPIESVAPIFKYKNPQNINLKIPDHPLVIELVPK